MYAMSIRNVAFEIPSKNAVNTFTCLNRQIAMKIHKRKRPCIAALYGNNVWLTLIARFMGPTLDPSGTDRTQLGPHIGPMNFAIWEASPYIKYTSKQTSLVWKKLCKKLGIFRNILICSSYVYLNERKIFLPTLNLQSTARFWTNSKPRNREQQKQYFATNIIRWFFVITLSLE